MGDICKAIVRRDNGTLHKAQRLTRQECASTVLERRLCVALNDAVRFTKPGMAELQASPCLAGQEESRFKSCRAIRAVVEHLQPTRRVPGGCQRQLHVVAPGLQTLVGASNAHRVEWSPFVLRLHLVGGI